jgi:hypothetical protein
MAENEFLSRDQQRARDAVRVLRPVSPDPRFRARIKDAFLGGTLAGVAFGALERSGIRARLARGWGFSVLAVAGTAILLMLFARPSPKDAWVVLASDPQGSVVVDGREFVAPDLTELASALRGGSVVDVRGSAPLEILCSDMFALQIEPGSRLTLPARTGRWFGKRVAASLHHGVVRVSTGPGFRGSRLRVRAPNALFDARSTTFAVLSNDEKTCVSVVDGEVEVLHTDGNRSVVGAGTRRTLPLDGDPIEEPLPSQEESELRLLRERAAGAFPTNAI